MDRPKFLPMRPSKPVFVIQSITESLRRRRVGNRTDYMSPYIIFGLPHRCLWKNPFDLPKNLFQQYRPISDSTTFDLTTSNHRVRSATIGGCEGASFLGL